MFAPSGDYAESRPFKIFISLLDKWEVGAPLTESLVYDAFRAIRRLVHASSEGGEDVGYFFREKSPLTLNTPVVDSHSEYVVRRTGTSSPLETPLLFYFC